MLAILHSITSFSSFNFATILPGGTGIGVAVRSRFDWETGWFFVDSDDEVEASEEIVLEEKDSYE